MTTRRGFGEGSSPALSGDTLVINWDHEGESFDSPAWRAWVRRAGNRVGLAIGGDLGAAIRVVTRTTETPTGFDLKNRVREDDDLRDLIAFCASASYAAARKQLGHDVQVPADDDE